MTPLNIGGSEWIIIIFAALILILGTNKLPEAAKKLGRASYEFNKAKNDVADQVKEVSGHTVKVDGPVQNEEQKLRTIARSLGINDAGMTKDDLQKAIGDMMGDKKA